MEEETSGGPLRGRDRRRCCCSCGWLVRSTVVTTIWRSRIPAAPSRFSRAVADRAQGPPSLIAFLFEIFHFSLAPDRTHRDPPRSTRVSTNASTRTREFFLEFTLTLDNISMRWLRTKVERLERIDLKLPRRGNQELVESTIRGKRDGELLK